MESKGKHTEIMDETELEERLIVNERVYIVPKDVFDAHYNLKHQNEVLREAVGDLIMAHDFNMGKNAIDIRISLAKQALTLEGGE